MHVRYVVLNNDEEPLMEYDLNGICETEDSIYCTRVPSGGVFAVWSTSYLTGISLGEILDEHRTESMELW